MASSYAITLLTTSTTIEKEGILIRLARRALHKLVFVPMSTDVRSFPHFVFTISLTLMLTLLLTLMLTLPQAQVLGGSQ